MHPEKQQPNLNETLLEYVVKFIAFKLTAQSHII